MGRLYIAIPNNDLAKTMSISTTGWYRIAEYKPEDSSALNNANSCNITIKAKNADAVNSETHHIRLLVGGATSSITSDGSKASDVQLIQKIRHTVDTTNNVAYLEIFVADSENLVDSNIYVIINNGADGNYFWQPIDPVSTEESADGVEVYSSLDIPKDSKGMATYDDKGNVISEAIDGAVKDASIVGVASGNIVSVDDSGDNTLPEIICYGKSTQESPSIDRPQHIYSVADKGKNLNLPRTQNNTNYGVNCVVDKDGIATINGTCTATAFISFVVGLPTLPAGTYILSGGTKDSSTETYGLCVYLDDTLYLDEGNGVEFTLTSSKQVGVYIRVYPEATADNVTFYPMVRKADIEDSTFEPYYGVNDLTIKTENEDSTNVTQATITLTDSLRGIKVASDGNYTDESGQQWVCDTIEKFSNNTGQITKCISEQVYLNVEWGVQTDGYVSTPRLNVPANITDGTLMCNMSTDVSTDSEYLNIKTDLTLEEFTEAISGKEVIVNYILEEPVITSLTAVQVAELEKLQSFNPTTSIYTDDIGDIQITYFKNNANANLVGNIPVALKEVEKTLEGELKEVESSLDNYQTKTVGIYNDGVGDWVKSGSSNGAKRVAFGNGMFVATDYSGIYYSTDGINWTKAIQTYSAEKLAFGNGVFVVLETSTGTSNGIYYSTDGITWTKNIISLGGGTPGLCFGNGKFICTGNKADIYSYYSTDGITWTKGGKAVGTSVAFGNGMFVTSSGITADDVDGYAYTSTDGITWTKNDLVTWGQGTNIAFGNGVFVTAGGQKNNIINTKLYYSTDGINWTNIYRLPDGDLIGVKNISFCNGQFIASGDRAFIYTSTDGVNWTKKELDFTIFDVVYANKKFVSGGSNFTCYAKHSTDPKNLEEVINELYELLSK